MKKRFLRIVSLICLSAFLLSGYGFADSAVFETLEMPENTQSTEDAEYGTGRDNAAAVIASNALNELPIVTGGTVPAESKDDEPSADTLPLEISVPVAVLEDGKPTEHYEPLTASNLIGKIKVPISNNLEENTPAIIIVPFFDANDRFLNAVCAKGILSSTAIGAKVTISRMNGTPAYGKVFIVDQNSNAFLSNTVEFTL